MAEVSSLEFENKTCTCYMVCILLVYGITEMKQLLISYKLKYLQNYKTAELVPVNTRYHIFKTKFNNL
jgi:hypothetical protein